MDLDKILAITYSGLRGGEVEIVKTLVAASGLHSDDLSFETLSHFIMARKGDRIVGIIGLEMGGNDALVRSLTVDREFHGKGVARGLLNAVERYARSREISALFVLTVKEKAFFEQQGYVSMDRKAVPEAIRAGAEFQRLDQDEVACLCKKLQ